MKHLVMLGAGHAHLHLLKGLAAQPLTGVKVTLVAAGATYFDPALLADHLAGHIALADCSISLAPLLAGSGASWLQYSATQLDLAARQLTLVDGSTLVFDVLSVHSGPWHDRQKIELTMPGAREHALFAYPCEALASLWPQVLAFAGSRALRVAVLGGGVQAAELAMAVAQRLPGSAVTLLVGDAPLASGHPLSLQTRLVRALKARHITLLRESACGFAEGVVTLRSGTQLACDVPLIALHADAPPWLHGSGLVLDEAGFASVDPFGCAIDHPEVFAAPDAAQAGLALAHNLRAVLAGKPPTARMPTPKAVQFVACGDRSAIASWGRFSAQGRWVGWLKQRLDQRGMRPFKAASAPPALG